MLKIGHFASSFFPRMGGIQTRMRNFCVCMPQYEHHIFVRNLYQVKGRHVATVPAGVKKGGCATIHRYVQKLPERMPDGSTSMYMSQKMLSDINKSDIDVLVMHSSGTPITGLAKFIKKPVVCSTVSAWPPREILALSNMRAAVSTKGRGYDWATTYHYKGKAYSIGPLINMEAFRDYQEGDPNTLCHVGRIMVGTKGLDRIVAALGKLKLVLIGKPDNPSDEAAFQKFLDASGKRKQVTVLGTVFDCKHLAQVMCRYRYAVFASPKETFCNSLLEALACNRVCLDMGVKGVEWAEPRYKVKNFNNIHKLERRGRDWVMERFNQDRIREQWDTLLKGVADGTV
jgi:glycosyltransferase involved in cell wall biosynthesis